MNMKQHICLFDEQDRVCSHAVANYARLTYAGHVVDIGYYKKGPKHDYLDKKYGKMAYQKIGLKNVLNIQFAYISYVYVGKIFTIVHICI